MEGAKEKSGLGGLGGALEGLKDKINGAAITDDSPAKTLTDVRARQVFGLLNCSPR